MVGLQGSEEDRIALQGSGLESHLDQSQAVSNLGKLGLSCPMPQFLHLENGVMKTVPISLRGLRKNAIC